MRCTGIKEKENLKLSRDLFSWIFSFAILKIFAGTKFHENGLKLRNLIPAKINTFQVKSLFFLWIVIISFGRLALFRHTFNR